MKKMFLLFCFFLPAAFTVTGQVAGTPYGVVISNNSVPPTGCPCNINDFAPRQFGSAGTWTTKNSTCGVPSEKNYIGHGDGERGYYYAWGDNLTRTDCPVCPSGYSLPTGAQWDALIAYINSSSATQAEKDCWKADNALAGEHNIGNQNWWLWGKVGVWFIAGEPDYVVYSVAEQGLTNADDPFQKHTGYFGKSWNYFQNVATYYLESVRCIKTTP